MSKKLIDVVEGDFRYQDYETEAHPVIWSGIPGAD